MVTLYHRPGDPQAEEIQEVLDEIVIAYDVEPIGPDTARPEDVPDLPALRTDGEVVTGTADLQDALDDLRALMNDWDQFQSDACHIDDDGTVC